MHKRLIVIVVSVLVVVLAAAILLIRGCGQEKEKELPPVKTTKPKPAVVHRPPKVVTSKAQWERMGKGELDLLRQGFILGHASRLKRILKHTTPDRIKKGFSYREMYKYLAQEAFLKEVKFGDFSQMGDIELAIEKYKIPGLQIVSVLPKAKVVACPKQKPLVRVIERPPTHRPVKKVRHICKPKPKTKVVVRKPCYRKHYPERHKPCVPPRLRDEG